VKPDAPVKAPGTARPRPLTRPRARR